MAGKSGSLVLADLHHLNGVDIVPNIPVYRIGGAVARTMTGMNSYGVFPYDSWAGIEGIQSISVARNEKIADEEKEVKDDANEEEDSENKIVYSISIDKNKNLRICEWDSHIFDTRVKNIYRPYIEFEMCTSMFNRTASN